VARRDVSEQLVYVAAQARELTRALMAYQRALIAARQAGASYVQLATALKTSESGARWRCKAAIDGGEIHLRLEPTQETGSEEQ
jgi:hypothetical protein